MISLDYKGQFLKNETIAKAHRELVVKDTFQVAVEMSLLIYMASQNAKGTVDDAMAFQRIVGAREFASVLLNIGEQPKPLETPKDTGLKYAN